LVDSIQLKEKIMEDSEAVIARANAMLAMMTPDEKEFVKRKANSTDILGLAKMLARREAKAGTRTAKVKLAKALIAVASLQ
jgi:hypothetical protein